MQNSAKIPLCSNQTFFYLFYQFYNYSFTLEFMRDTNYCWWDYLFGSSNNINTTCWTTWRWYSWCAPERPRWACGSYFFYSYLFMDQNLAIESSNKISPFLTIYLNSLFCPDFGVTILDLGILFQSNIYIFFTSLKHYSSLYK